MCRTKNYQKRRTRHAAVQYVQTCIVKVQSVYRGYVTRKQFLQLRRALYFDGSGGMAVGIDGSRRRALAAGMLNDINRRLKVNAIKKDQQLKTLFHELDRYVALARGTYKHVHTVHISTTCMSVAEVLKQVVKSCGKWKRNWRCDPAYTAPLLLQQLQLYDPP